MNMDKDELIALMYRDEPKKETTNQTQINSGFSRTRKIRVGAIEYEVPTVEYMNRLEQLVVHQAKTVEELLQRIDRLNITVISTRNFIRRQTNRLNEMQNDLSGKIDYREEP